MIGSIRHGRPWSLGLPLTALFGALAAAFVLLLATAASASAQDPGPASGDGIDPVFIAGNPNCATLNASTDPAFATITSNFGFKVQGSPNGTFTFHHDPPAFELTGGAPPDPNNSATISNSDGSFFDWAATLGIDAVIVKGGPNADAYVYDPEDLGDTDLHPPINPNNDKPFGISHIEFCYDYELGVKKDAKTTFTRDWDWSLTKTNDAPDPVDLMPDEAFSVNYEVTATVDGFADSNWAVSGQIEVKNPHPTLAAAGVDVTDETSGIGSVAVDCNGDDPGTGLPATIAPGATLICAYSSALPDGTARTNTASATTTTAGIGGGSGSAAVAFGDPTTKVDECVDVLDDMAGPLGTACVNESPKKFSYSRTFTFGEEDCGEFTVTNTASIPDDTASSNVNFNVKCPDGGGCTLTQGYWKTHSREGPAPYDEAWKNLGVLEEDTLFLNKTVTWYTLFWTPPKGGNAYIILAHQYQAATLNKLNGASVPPAVQAALSEATALLTNNPINPAPTGAKKSKMLAQASILDSYNNGLIGPGHCSEDSSSKA